MSSEKTETKNRILQAACDLLEKGPGSSVRMSDIAKASGISRQAVYLHFPKRAELLIAALRYLDEQKNIGVLLEKSRNASAGIERLEAFIEAWFTFIPEIFGVASAILSMREHDKEADAAWQDRMAALRHGCDAAVDALMRDGDLASHWERGTAVDWLMVCISMQNWAYLVHECGWSEATALSKTRMIAVKTLTE